MTIQTIIDQLVGRQNGLSQLIAFTGAFNLMRDNSNTWISFKFKGSKAANYCKIILDADDTYTMTLGKIKGANYTKTEFKGLYSDMLKSTFEKNTGLVLSF